MHTRFSRPAALALAAFGLNLATPASAAVTITRNIDEPARNPFQQTVGVPSGCTGPCNLNFAAVPAKKTLRITNVSCWFQAGDNNGIRLAYINNGNATGALAFLPTVQQGNAQYLIANAEINLYSSAASVPVVTIDTNTSALSNGACTVSGYTIN